MTDRFSINVQNQQSKQVVNLNYLDREAALFKQSKESLNTNAKEIQTARIYSVEEVEVEEAKKDLIKK